MTEAEWLACDPDEMYQHAVDRLRCSVRRKDLFCLACAHLIWDLLEDDARRPFEWLEDHLGERQKPRFQRSTRHVRELFEGPAQSLYDAHHRREGGVAGAAAHVAYDFWADWYAYAFPNLCDDYPFFRDVLPTNPRDSLVSIVRDIFGNPFLPVVFDHRWRSETAVSLAAGIDAERAFDRMPILADALEDAGCDNADILSHCRGQGPHIRGCWVVDLVLDKE